MVVWFYKAVLVPRVVFASVVCWPKTGQVSVFKKFERLRGLKLRQPVGAICTASLGMLLGVPPLHLEIKDSSESQALLRKLAAPASRTRLVSSGSRDILGSEATR